MHLHTLLCCYSFTNTVNTGRLGLKRKLTHNSLALVLSDPIDLLSSVMHRWNLSEYERIIVHFHSAIVECNTISTISCIFIAIPHN